MNGIIHIVFIAIVASYATSSNLDLTTTCAVEGDCVVPKGCELPKHGASTLVRLDDIQCIDLDQDARYCDTDWRRHLPSEWQIQGDNGRVNSWKLYPSKKVEVMQYAQDVVLLEYHGELVFTVPMGQSTTQDDTSGEQAVVRNVPSGKCERLLRVSIRPHGRWAISNTINNIWSAIVILAFIIGGACCLCGKMDGTDFAMACFFGALFGSLFGGRQEDR